MLSCCVIDLMMIETHCSKLQKIPISKDVIDCFARDLFKQLLFNSCCD